jgi:thiol-disulfide isomerase/thioredoxin
MSPKRGRDRRGRDRLPVPATAGRSRRRATRWWQGPRLIVAAAAGIALVLVAFVLLGQASPGSQPEQSADPAVTGEVTHVDQAVSDAVGTGGLPNPLNPASGGTPLSGPSGKPEVLYVGADWCPYCAAQRWSLVVALSRFGDFQGLRLTTSSSSDVFPNTPTLTFAGSSLRSGALDFVAVELADRQRKPLASPTAQENQLLQTYDPQGGIPFVDVANRYIAISSGYQPDVLAGLSWKPIADALRDPNSPVTRAIVGNANYLTAAICQAAGQNAAPACAWPSIQQIATQLPK